MLDFDQYLVRHDEIWVQDIVERLERYDGIKANTCLSLEERWKSVMSGGSVPCQMAA